MTESAPIPLLRTVAKICVAGHARRAGSAITRQLRVRRYHNLVTRSHAQLELTEQRATRDFFRDQRPAVVFLCAARVGGIGANSRYPAECIYSNLAIQANVIHGAWAAGVERLVFLGFEWHASKPDAPPRKLLDTTYLRSSGSVRRIGPHEGIRLAYRDFLTRAAHEPSAMSSDT